MEHLPIGAQLTASATLPTRAEMMSARRLSGQSRIYSNAKTGRLALPPFESYDRANEPRLRIRSLV